MDRPHATTHERRGRVGRALGWGLRCGAFTLALSCGGSQQPAAGAKPAPNDVAHVESELDAAGWRLTEFKPDLSPGPILGPLLSQQLGQLVLHFDHGQMHADSPTLHATRTYQLTDAAGPMFRFATPDEGGLLIHMNASFNEEHDRVAFRVDNEPFRGQGVLERVR